MTIQALVTGRVGLDLYPEQAERRLEDVDSFRQYAGGFATNVATGLARLGVRTAVFSAVGDDGHGRHVRRFLEREGVDTAWLATDPALPTTVTFCEIWPPDDFPITFHRAPTCPDWEVTLESAGVDLRAAAAVPLLYLSATALARRPSGDAAIRLAEARRGGAGGRHTILDLDWRPALWPSRSAYAEAVRSVLPLAGVVLGGDAEWRAAGLDPGGAGDAVRVAKHGPRGCTVHLPDGTRQEAPGLPVPVVNGLGAGDAFAAAFGWALLEGAASPGAAANAAGALVATRHSCSAAMPTAAELETFRRTGRVPRAAPDQAVSGA